METDPTLQPDCKPFKSFDLYSAWELYKKELSEEADDEMEHWFSEAAATDRRNRQIVEELKSAFAHTDNDYLKNMLSGIRFNF